jgi:hypothetical protein
MQASDILYLGAGALAAVIFVAALAFAAAGFDGRRLGLALRGFGRMLRDRAFADRVEPLLAPAPPAPAGPPKPSAEPVRLLALLQRDGRLVDFLMEDVRGAAPDQIVAAVRNIHPQCQAALKKHVVLEPVFPEPEGSTVEVPAGFDPAAVRLVGNVTGQPPFRGTLQHSGWRVKDLHLPPVPEGQDGLVLMPAEVELP